MSLIGRATALCALSILSVSASSLGNAPTKPKAKPQAKEAVAKPLRAKYLVTVADDFIINIYHNGKQVPDAQRNLVDEIYGATVEHIKIEVKKGDWLVFNVVNNRMRWGGASYFAVAGCCEKNEFGFTSKLDDGAWSACDSLKEVDDFIAKKKYLRHNAVRRSEYVWPRGVDLMQGYAGDRWAGEAVWGTSRNTWLKVIIE